MPDTSSTYRWERVSSATTDEKTAGDDEVSGRLIAVTRTQEVAEGHIVNALGFL